MKSKRIRHRAANKIRQLFAPKQIHAKPRENNTSDKQADAEAPPKTPEPEVPQTQDGAERAYGETKEGKQPRWTDQRWQTILTGVIASTTIAYAIVAFYQWRSMKQAVEIAQQTLTVSQRAYVGVHSIQTELNQRQVTIWLENIGRIPAKNLKVSAGFALTPMPPKSGGSFQLGAEEVLALGDLELFPGNFRVPVIVTIKDFSGDDKSLIYSGQKLLVISCAIKYDAGFGDIAKSIFVFQYEPPPTERWVPVNTEMKKDW